MARVIIFPDTLILSVRTRYIGPSSTKFIVGTATTQYELQVYEIGGSNFNLFGFEVDGDMKSRGTRQSELEAYAGGMERIRTMERERLSGEESRPEDWSLKTLHHHLAHGMPAMDSAPVVHDLSLRAHMGAGADSAEPAVETAGRIIEHHVEAPRPV